MTDRPQGSGGYPVEQIIATSICFKLRAYEFLSLVHILGGRTCCLAATVSGPAFSRSAGWCCSWLRAPVGLRPRQRSRGIGSCSRRLRNRRPCPPPAVERVRRARRPASQPQPESPTTKRPACASRSLLLREWSWQGARFGPASPRLSRWPIPFRRSTSRTWRPGSSAS